jgi:DNA mismatch repair protein MSH5
MALYLSLYSLKNKLGLAYYDPEILTLHFGETYVLVNDYSFLYQLVVSLEPVITVISTQASQSLLDILKGFTLTSLPNSHFDYEKSLDIIISHSKLETDFKAATSFNTHNTAMVCAAGGLISYLRSSTDELRNDCIHRITQVNLSCVSCDLETLSSLHIIKEDYHPSKIKNPGRSKEGFSLLGILDRTKTAQGKKLLRQWVIRPLISMEEINNRLDLVEFFLYNINLATELQTDLKKIKDLDRICARFSEFKAKSADWECVYNSIKGIVAIAIKLSKHDLPERLRSLLEIDYSSLEKLSQLIESNLDLSDKSSVKIQPGVSHQLDYLKKCYSELQDFLIKLIHLEQSDISRLGVRFSSINIIYIIKHGYLIHLNTSRPEYSLINTDSTLSSPGDTSALSILKYSLEFSEVDNFYFKSPRMMELDAKFGDMEGSLKDLELDIVRQFEEVVVKQCQLLKYMGKITAELDALIALSINANNYNLVRPKILPSPGIEIINGRHMLVEFCVDNFIPNDCALSDVHKVALITGPNYSGKSVYIKMVAIIVYIAHIGAFVPAESASIGLCDKIFARLCCSESRNQSAFAQEIAQLSIAISNSTERSLVILDEFGKGTSAEDGMALVGALVRYLDKPEAPLSLITTHYQELINYDIIQESDTVKFYTMELPPTEQPIFLYKLIRGRPIGSFGIKCASWAGLSEGIITRAVEIKKSLIVPRSILGSGDSRYLKFVEILRNFTGENLSSVIEQLRELYGQVA